MTRSRRLNYSDITNQYLNGKTTTQLAIDNNCTPSAIAFAIKSMGINMRSTYKNLPVDKIIEMYNSGISAIKISKIYKCNEASIYYILNKHNIEIRPNKKIDYTEVISLRESGKTLKEISEKLNCSINGIYCIVNKNNISRGTSELKENAIKLFNSGMRLKDISKKLNYNYSSLVYLIRTYVKNVKFDTSDRLIYLMKGNIRNVSVMLRLLFSNNEYIFNDKHHKKTVKVVSTTLYNNTIIVRTSCVINGNEYMYSVKFKISTINDDTNDDLTIIEITNNGNMISIKTGHDFYKFEKV